MHLVGDVKGRNCIVIDDLIDTAGSIVRAAEVLRREGAERILVAATHAVLSGPAISRIHGIRYRSGRRLEHDSADTGEGDPENQGFECRPPAGRGDSIDTQGDLGQQTVQLRSGESRNGKYSSSGNSKRSGREEREPPASSRGTDSRSRVWTRDYPDCGQCRSARYPSHTPFGHRPQYDLQAGRGRDFAATC